MLWSIQVGGPPNSVSSSSCLIRSMHIFCLLHIDAYVVLLVLGVRYMYQTSCVTI